MKIIPAILTNDITDLQDKLTLLNGVTDWVQIDIMDGTLADNATLNIKDISRLPVVEDFLLEAHLMVSHPASYFRLCQDQGIKRVIFHIEAGGIEALLQEAQKYNFEIGVALNPEIPIEKVLSHLDKIDVVLLMSVNPGKQGQTFILKTLDKIKELKKIAPEIKIEVDGGINLDNIKLVVEAGADYLVVGSGLFQAKNIQERFKELESKLI